MAEEMDWYPKVYNAALAKNDHEMIVRLSCCHDMVAKIFRYHKGNKMCLSKYLGLHDKVDTVPNVVVDLDNSDPQLYDSPVLGGVGDAPVIKASLNGDVTPKDTAKGIELEQSPSCYSDF